jgi:hypothetical protein
VIGSPQTLGDADPTSQGGPTPEPAKDPAPPAAAATPPRRPGLVRRVLEWFWRSRALSALRADGRVGSPRVQELMRRAWLCVEVAERMLRPTPRLVNGDADGPARELLREAVYWALRAEQLIRADGTGAPTSEPPDDGTVKALWARADLRLLSEVAGGEGAAHALEAGLMLERFSDFAELAAEEQARQARDLGAFARNLLATLEVPRVRLDKLYTQRVLRTGGGILVLFALVGAALFARSWQERQRDLTRDRPWKASSTYPAVGCKSPHQECPESPFFFFHTLEDERPWVEIDLGSKKRFSQVKLVNREDCCGERSVPIGIEVSNDRKTWREVTRRTEPYTSWSQRFAPVNARYVRAVGLRKTAIHLKRFAVLR